MKRESLAIILFFAISVVAISQFENSFFASANWEGASYLNIEISPQSVGANPPTITFLSPENNKTYGSNLTLHCNISVGDVTLRNMSCSIENLYYQADWENNQTKVVRLQLNQDGRNWDTIITGTVNSNLTEFSTDLKVPTEGKHNITFWAAESGNYQVNVGKRFPALEGINIYTFHMNSSKTVTFTVDNSSSKTGLTLTPSPTPNNTALMPTVNTGPQIDLAMSSILYIVGIVAVIIVLIVGLLVYFKKASTKRRKIIIACIVIVVLTASLVGALTFYQQLTPTPSADAIKVSGLASSSALSQPFPTSLQRIEFADSQTGTVTTFNFPFPQQSNNPTGNYSVYLKNEHTYNVFISYYHGISPHMKEEKDYFTAFTVHASNGEKAISKDFS